MSKISKIFLNSMRRRQKKIKNEEAEN